MQVSIVRTDGEFHALENEWNDLLERSSQDNLFLTFDWLYTWWKHFGDKLRLFIVKVVQDGELIGLAPLVIQKAGPMNYLNFMGSQLADFEDILACGDDQKRKEIIHAILAQLFESKEWDILRLKKIKEGSRHFHHYCELVSEDNIDGIQFKLDKHCDGAPYLMLKENFEAFNATLRSKFRSDTKRRLNRLKEKGNVSYQRAESNDQIHSWVKDIKQLHIQRRTHKGDLSFLEDKRAEDFFVSIGEKFLKKHWLHLSCLKLGEEPVAIHFGYQYRDIFHYYMPVFNEEFKPYAVSRLLLLETFKECFDENVKKFDFMLGEESYKQDWHPQMEPLYYLSAYRKNVRGQLSNFFINSLNKGVKKVLGKKW